MAVGGCFCGKIRYEYIGQPIASGLCHCDDCRKLTSTLFSYSIMINRADLKITGTPKEVAKTADSGNRMKNYFCGDCGTPIYGNRLESNGEPASIAMLRGATFDNPEVFKERKPVVEVYTEKRVSWLKPIEGAEQFEGMLPW
ncbi:Mss4-like protein [Aspergillus unguis]